MSHEILDVVALDNGNVYTVETAGGRGQKSSSRGVVCHYAPQEFVPKIIHEGERFDAIGVGPAGELFVGSSKGRLHSIISGEWKATNLKLPHLLSVFAVGTKVFVGGCKGTLATVGEDPQQLGDMIFTGIHGVSATDVWATGDGTVAHYDGDCWKFQPKPAERVAFIRPLALSEDDVLLCARGGLFRGNKDGFRKLDGFGDQDFYGATIFNNEIYVAAGSDGVLKLTGDDLSLALGGVAAFAIHSCTTELVTSGMSYLTRFDGTKWSVNQ